MFKFHQRMVATWQNMGESNLGIIVFFFFLKDGIVAYYGCKSGPKWVGKKINHVFVQRVKKIKLCRPICLLSSSSFSSFLFFSFLFFFFFFLKKKKKKKKNFWTVFGTNGTKFFNVSCHTIILHIYGPFFFSYFIKFSVTF
jgi:hypothetical protein